MDKINVFMKHCYGIKELKEEFDFSKKNASIIYASNGSMKTSFLKSFNDYSKGDKPKDEYFSTRKTEFS